MSWRKPMFDVCWDVDKYKSYYDAEHWHLCRAFMETHKSKYPERKLANLTEAFYQMGVYGSSYDPRTTRMVNALTVEVVDGILKSRPETFPHFFNKSAVVVTEEVSIGAMDQLSNEDTEPSKPSSIWTIEVNQSIIANVLIMAQLKKIFNGFVIIYDIWRDRTLNTDKVKILEDSFRRSKFGQCYWSTDYTNDNTSLIRMSLVWQNIVLAEAIGADENSVKTRLAQAILSKLANFSIGIEAKWSYYRDGRLPKWFEFPDPKKSNLYKVMRRSQFKNKNDIRNFIDTFANSNSFAEIVFGTEFNGKQKTALRSHITRFWRNKLSHRTLSKVDANFKSSENNTYVIVSRIHSGEELQLWLEEFNGENDRYRIVPPGKHRHAGSCDNNVIEVLTTDAVEMSEAVVNEVAENENKEKVTNEGDKEKLKSSQESEDELKKLLGGFISFYETNEGSEIDKEYWFTAFCESFKLSKFGILEVIKENSKPFRTWYIFKWEDKVLASAVGLTETEAKTAATLQLISKAKEEFFFEETMSKSEKDPDKKMVRIRLIRRKDFPDFYSLFRMIDEFEQSKSNCELVFGSDFCQVDKNEIITYLKTKGLSHRYFKSYYLMLVYHTVKPEELKDQLLKSGSENEKHKLPISEMDCRPMIVDKTLQETSTKETEEPNAPSLMNKPFINVAEKRKQEEFEPPASLVDGSNKIQLKKSKMDEVEYPEDTGGDFPGLILWIGIQKNSVCKRDLNAILMDTFKMNPVEPLQEVTVGRQRRGRNTHSFKCTIKSSDKVLAVGYGGNGEKAKNDAYLQVLHRLRHQYYTIQAKVSYFMDGLATPYSSNTDHAKPNVYKVMRRTEFKDRGSIFKFVTEFSKNSCPEEVIFGLDFSDKEREEILHHCREINLSYRLLNLKKKKKHSHIAIFHQRPLSVIKAELIKAGGENDMYRLIPPGGKITNQRNVKDMWPDTLENIIEVPPSETEKFTENIKTGQPIVTSQSNEPEPAKKQSPPEENMKTNQTFTSSNPIPSLINRVPVVGTTFSSELAEKQQVKNQKSSPDIEVYDLTAEEEEEAPKMNYLTFNEGGNDCIRYPHFEQLRMSFERNQSKDCLRERLSFTDLSEKSLRSDIRHREGSSERRGFHDSIRDSREDGDRIQRDRFRSRSPPRIVSRGKERSQSPDHYKDFWKNIPSQLAKNIFMIKFVKQYSTTETNPYALLRSTVSLSCNIDFDFYKEKLSKDDDWRVWVKLITDDVNIHPLVGKGKARKKEQASLQAACHAVEMIQRACHVIEPNYRYFCEGGVPDFIAMKRPLNSSVYEIIRNLEPGTPLSLFMIDTMLQMLISSNLEDLFFVASEFSLLERSLVIEMAIQKNLGWRMFGPRQPGTRADTLSTQHVCVYKQKTALQLVRELIASGGHTVKYSLVNPRK